MKLLLIVPAYNEEENIVNTVGQILDFKEKYSDDVELDYIVINDGSTDSTERVCKENNIKCISITWVSAALCRRDIYTQI